MRLGNKRSPQYDSGPNLTSLVDVVMVVLIFLMLAGSMGSLHVLKGSPVRARAGHGSTTSPPPIALDIRVQEDATTGSFIATGPNLRVMGNTGQLLQALQTKHREYAAAGLAPGNVQVVIRPSRNVRYQHVLSVYETAARAEFPHVAFATSE